MLRFAVIATVFIGSLFAMGQSSEACSRCGIFGRGCRYSYYPTYYQPVQYQPPISNFVFNNSYPVPYLAQQGNTAYGYSMSALPYQVDVAGGFDRAGRLAEVAYQGGHDVMTQFNASLQNAAAVNEASTRRAQIAAVTAEGIRAMAVNPPNAAPPQTLNFSATLQGGRWQMNQPTAAPLPQPGYNGAAGPVSPYGDPNAANGGQYGIGYNICATCHDGAGTHNEPKRLVYNGSRAITPGEFQEGALAIETGHMPPASSNIRLTPQDKAIILTELAKMVANPPAAEVPPPVPQQVPPANGGGQVR